MIEDDDSQELIAIDMSTSSHSVDAYDIDNIQLFTRDIVYAKHTSGIAFIAEILEIGNRIYLREVETAEKSILEPEFSLKLLGDSIDLRQKNPYPF